MSKSFTLQQLTEGIRDRNVGAEGQRLIEKWSRTGLLRGLADHNREIMSRLLENQAAQLLREQNSLSSGGGNLASSGDIRGFTNIAFPIVRRVFGGLVSNELVSIQPMSLPSGLLFYLDYTYGTQIGGDSNLQTGDAGTDNAQQFTRGQSIYNLPTGRGVQSGSLAVGGQYDLVGSTYTKVHQSMVGQVAGVASTFQLLASGAYVGSTGLIDGRQLAATGSDAKLIGYDPQVLGAIQDNLTAAGVHNKKGVYQFAVWDVTNFPAGVDLSQAKGIGLYTQASNGGQNPVGTAGLHQFTVSDSPVIQGGNNLVNVRRLNMLGLWDATARTFTPSPLVTRATNNAALLTVQSGTYAMIPSTTDHNMTASYVLGASLNVDTRAGDTLTIPTFESDFAAAPSPNIPEIDIKIESIAVTAQTRKLRARWSPELAQDLNAYHSLDAEVELTQILSEQIALEIDREILNDLLVEAQGANYYWSRAPGKFVNKRTGVAQNRASTLAAGPRFTGTVREWYETLTETIIDVANEIHRKTLRGSANFCVVSPEVATVFEASVLYKPNISLDGQGQTGNPFTLGATPIGTLSNRFTVYKDPYFPRNKVLVGYKGGSYLETGYVYAPYVPLIVTPTIFAPEDFTPRKGVMTRYGKKMVRADFYGTVTVLDMDVI